jgi:hypothetical protein
MEIRLRKGFFSVGLAIRNTNLIFSCPEQYPGNSNIRETLVIAATVAYNRIRQGPTKEIKTRFDPGRITKEESAHYGRQYDHAISWLNL